MTDLPSNSIQTDLDRFTNRYPCFQIVAIDTPKYRDEVAELIDTPINMDADVIKGSTRLAIIYNSDYAHCAYLQTYLLCLGFRPKITVSNKPYWRYNPTSQYIWDLAIRMNMLSPSDRNRKREISIPTNNCTFYIENSMCGIHFLLYYLMLFVNEIDSSGSKHNLQYYQQQWDQYYQITKTNLDAEIAEFASKYDLSESDIAQSYV